MDLIAGAHMSAASVNFKKSYLFHATSDEDDFYMKIVALNEIFSFIVSRFLI